MKKYAFGTREIKKKIWKSLSFTLPGLIVKTNINFKSVSLILNLKFYNIYEYLNDVEYVSHIFVQYKFLQGGVIFFLLIIQRSIKNKIFIVRKLGHQQHLSRLFENDHGASTNIFLR